MNPIAVLLTCLVFLLGACASAPVPPAPPPEAVALPPPTDVRVPELEARVQALEARVIADDREIGIRDARIADLTQRPDVAEAPPEWLARMADLKAVFAAEIASGKVRIQRFRDVLVIDFQEAVLFPPDSPALRADNLGLLLRLAEVFKRSPSRMVRVEGNTAVAVSSPESLKLYPTSWHLGAARAANVVQFLQQSGGMDPHQLLASSLGEYNPVMDNATDQGKSFNRRVEFVMVPQELWRLDRRSTGP